MRGSRRGPGLPVPGAPPGPRARRAARPRHRGLSGGALVAGGGLAMVAGLATGALLSGLPPAAQTAVALDEVTRTEQPAPEPGDPSGGSEVLLEEDVAARGLEGTAVRRPLPVAPPEAEPASPLVLEMDTVAPDGLTLADHAAGLLSADVPRSGTGELLVVPGEEPAPHPERTVRTGRVEVEGGLDIDGDRFAAMVMDVLNDSRGWGGDGSLSFARTDAAAQIRVVLASPDTVDRMCAPLRTNGVYSCGRNGHAAINHTRWVEGTDEFVEVADLTVYRQYVINHEVGHLLGRPHVQCPGDGLPAPIMQQQSIRVAPCVPNGWPFPDAG